ncbi:hypothetical protein [Streptomyces sp. NPDC055749]
MAHPTAAQLSYGSVTVVFSTLAMLLLSRAESVVGVAVIGTAALALGLLVALTVPLPKLTRTSRTATAPAAVRTRQPLDEIAAKVPAARSAERVEEHSLRR